MRHLDLFSGVGGFALACQWNGIETIGFVEIDKYCQKVLKKHWPNVPIVEDIRDVERIKEIVANATSQGACGLSEDTALSGNWGDKILAQRIHAATAPDVGRNDNGWRSWGTRSNELPAVLITAGFPCQPFSVAGKQLSQADDRYLWPQTIAVIKEVKPQWVLLENVTGIINLALDTVLSDLEGAGYAAETVVIPACAVNAWHRRDRVWIVAHGNGNREGERYRCNPVRDIPRTLCDGRNSKDTQDKSPYIDNGCQDVGYPSDARLQIYRDRRDLRQQGTSRFASAGTRADWWAVEPQLGRVATRFSTKLDGGIDDKASNQEAITKELQSIWEGLCEMWQH